MVFVKVFSILFLIKDLCAKKEFKLICFVVFESFIHPQFLPPVALA